MTPSELRKKWAEALRSDRYKQAQEALRTHEGYCCLGVLCDIYDPERWSDLEYIKDPDDEYTNTESDYPPPDVLEAAGIDKTVAQELAKLNDQECLPFSRIADVVERDDIAMAITEVQSPHVHEDD